METELHILTEYSPFSMGFVIITRKGNAVVIDGGRPEELANLKAHIGDRRISAWILTHPHADHITAFNALLRKHSPLLEQTDMIVCNFHPYEFYKECGTSESTLAPLADFNEHRAWIEPKIYEAKAGDMLEFDEVKIEFLFHRNEKLKSNSVNDSSLVFRVFGARKNILFLADLGPEGGDVLLEEYGNHLKSDVVQMAHHGHMGVSKEVYEAIQPQECIWCCASWLYNEPDKQFSIPRMYGVGTTRRWMDELGVTQHYVTKDGDQIICF